MTDAGLRRLLELHPNLTRIEARGTSATEEGVRALRSTHPGCEIVVENLGGGQSGRLPR